jgi:uncharacterized protein YacL (UPF0231 family)
MMNYQFIRDQQGSPVAEFDMGSEIFSQWFTQELGTDQHKIEAIFKAIQELRSRQIKEFVLQGNEINLLFDPDEVEARSKILDIQAPDELPDNCMIRSL